MVGDVFLHWPGRTVTEGDHHLFCLLTNSLNPIHVDQDASRRDPVFGRVVVVGAYIYPVLAGMSGADVSGSAIANLGVEHLEHTAPLYPGDTLYAESEVLAVRPASSATDRGVVTLETRGWNQHDTAVCRFTRALLVWRRACFRRGRWWEPGGDPVPTEAYRATLDFLWARSRDRGPSERDPDRSPARA